MRAANHQLALPAVSVPPPAPRFTAKRDLSEAAFQRALDRHGFVQIAPTRFAYLQARRWHPVEALYRVNPIRIARRATLAKLLLARNANA